MHSVPLPSQPVVQHLPFPSSDRHLWVTQLTDWSASLQQMGAETTTVALDAAILPVVGCLDGEAGLRLLAAARGVLAAGAVRLEVDLCQVADFTPPGAAALLACRHLAHTLGDARGPGP